MQIPYKNERLETVMIGCNITLSVLVVATFVSLFGFRQPLLAVRWLYAIQVLLLAFFAIEKVIRTFNAQSRWLYWRVHWYEIPLWIFLLLVAFAPDDWSEWVDTEDVLHFAVGVYLVLQVVLKACRTTVKLVAKGRNPTRMLIASFLILIVVGAGVLCLPNASTGEPLGFVDALFTATSATCVTGLVVKDTGTDFSFMGQLVILTLIQLGGLGIVVFGAVFSLLLGQALSLRESVAMQDLLNTNTLTRIGNMIGFIFGFTLIVEILGTVGLMTLWRSDPNWTGAEPEQWFYCIFHAISAFCNAGFGLYGDSLERFGGSWQVYAVIVPLIVLGGMGFGVLYNLCNVCANRIKRACVWLFSMQARLAMRPPKPVSLQAKIVVSVSVLLIVGGTVSLYVLERWSGGPEVGSCASWRAAFFQSVTARTAGFNTIAINEMTPAGRLVLMGLMFLGGSPGSTAGGIKTVTLAVIVMAIVTTLRRRSEVEIFRRAVDIAVVGRAITVMGLFIVVLVGASFLLTFTERGHADQVTLWDILFETTSALGTVGLTTGITPILTGLGKCIIIVVMLVGRLGPLTLLAALTFDLKAARFNYPREPLVVG